MSSESILKACAIVGGQSCLARLLGIKPPTINQWAKGIRPVPAERCIDIERITKRAVLCEQLRPDIDWAFIRIPVTDGKAA